MPGFNITVLYKGQYLAMVEINFETELACRFRGIVHVYYFISMNMV